MGVFGDPYSSDGNYDLPGDEIGQATSGENGTSSGVFRRVDGSTRTTTTSGSSGGGGGSGGGPGSDTSAGPARSAAEFIAEVRVLFPWMDEIGLDPSWIHEIAATASGPDEVLLKLRQSPQYQARFPGMYRADGTVRMNEAQYMAREQDYRSLLRQHGYDLDDYSSPSALVGFFENEMAPDELGQRLDVYRSVSQSSQAQKDAFYVYAGLEVTDDDLYEAVVDPAARQRLADEYNQRIAGGQFDYETWITRATEVGLRRVADTLTAMQARGAVTSRAVQAVLSTNADFARQIMDAIYTGGDPNDISGNMNLSDVLEAFEYAAVGAAAREAGLEMPTRERLAEIRARGVQRQQQIDAYTSFGQNDDLYDAASRRAGYGGFTQEEFEDAAFFGDAEATLELSASLAQEAAAGRGSGEFRFAEDDGRIVQRGLGRR